MYSTEFIDNMLEQCDSIDELKKSILPTLEDQRKQWIKKFDEILRSGHSVAEIARLCKVSETSVRKWKNGSIPQSRDMFLRIGFAAGYDLQEMNKFLTRYGKYPQLCVKSLEDSACMFVLQSPTVSHTYASYLHILDLVGHRLQETKIVSDEGVHLDCSTQFLSEQFFRLTELDEVLNYVQENALSFRQSYSRFYNYVIAFLNENLNYRAEWTQDERKRSFHEIAEEYGWSSSLQQCIYDIRKKTWVPRRIKVISLGIHLNMDVESINWMLTYARMEPLYSKNPIEAMVIWAITDYEMNTEECAIIRDGSDELCEYVKNVLLELGAAEAAELLGDL